MPLTDANKASIRAYLGYPVVQAAASIFMGIPRPTPIGYILETAMNLIMESSVPRVLEILNVLGGVEQRMIDSQAYLVASKLEDLTLSENHPQRLEEEFNRWAQRLADMFGVPLYGYAARFDSGDGDARAAGGKVVNIRRM